MPDLGHHCPFLNRTDARCSDRFHLNALGYAFDYCFGYYQGCGAYLELLVERRVRRARAGVLAGAFAADGTDGADGGYDDGAPRDVERDHADRGRGAGRFTPITVAGRVLEGAADPALVSHAPGV